MVRLSDWIATCFKYQIFQRSCAPFLQTHPTYYNTVLFELTPRDTRSLVITPTGTPWIFITRSSVSDKEIKSHEPHQLNLNLFYIDLQAILMLPTSSNRDRHPRTCVCKCRSHCTTWNTSTGSYEGDGKVVSRSTRDNHAQDDKLREQTTNASECSRIAVARSLKIQSPTGYRPSLDFTMPGANADLNVPQHFDRIKLMEDEVLWYGNLPVTNPWVPLVFVNDPIANGQYQWPSQAELLQPNAGLHALQINHHANSAFLATEGRYCELVTILQSQEQSDKTRELDKVLRSELARLTYEKELQWIQQQGGNVRGMVLVNTGGCTEFITCCGIEGLIRNPLFCSWTAGSSF